MLLQLSSRIATRRTTRTSKTQLLSTPTEQSALLQAYSCSSVLNDRSCRADSFLRGERLCSRGCCALHLPLTRFFLPQAGSRSHRAGFRRRSVARLWFSIAIRVAFCGSVDLLASPCRSLSQLANNNCSNSLSQSLPDSHLYGSASCTGKRRTFANKRATGLFACFLFIPRESNKFVSCALSYMLTRMCSRMRPG